MTTPRASILAVAAVALFSACDKSYFARLDVGPYEANQVGVRPLTAQEHERAVAVFSETAKALGLACQPSEAALITNSYSSSEYRLSKCTRQGGRAYVEFADSASHVSIEIQAIAGNVEPTFFAQCRHQFVDSMKKAFPVGRVTVRYPYNWDQPGR